MKKNRIKVLKMLKDINRKNINRNIMESSENKILRRDINERKFNLNSYYLLIKIYFSLKIDV